MTKMTVTPPSMILAPASLPELGSVRRLMVLVPPLEVDLSAVTRRIWELAKASGAHVQFIGLYNDPAQEPRLRRDLVTMSAMTNDDRISTDVEVVFGKDWVATIRSRWQPGDMVLCFEEQRVGLSHRPLSQMLRSDLDIPLYILTGLYPQDDPRSGWPARTAAWIGAIAIIAGFFMLQAKIGQFENGWTSILQLLSILVEAGLLLAWNSLFG
jgi:hypothetical protein